jgi:hypothetical protein
MTSVCLGYGDSGNHHQQNLPHLRRLDQFFRQVGVRFGWGASTAMPMSIGVAAGSTFLGERWPRKSAVVR